MADRWAVATGNWSNTATWNGGTLPTSADDVYANGFIVTIDQTITVLSIRTTTRSGGTANGTFVITPGVTINATGSGILSSSTNQSHFTISAGSTATTINANITGGLNSGTQINASAFTGTLTVNGNLVVGSVNNSQNTGINAGGPVVFTGNITGVNCGAGNNGGGGILTTAASATISVTGNITQGNAGGNSAANVLGTSGLTAHITVVGNVVGHPSTQSGATAAAIATSGAQSTISVTGNLTAGAGPAGSICIGNGTNSASKLITVIGTVTASIGLSTLGSHAISDTNSGGGWTIVGGSLIDSVQGDCAVFARRFRCIPTLNTVRQHANHTGYPSGGMLTYGSLDYIPNNVPTPANVRLGTVYGNNSFTGTMSIPSAVAVRKDVPIDNTVGTAALDLGDIASAIGAQIAALGGA